MGLQLFIFAPSRAGSQEILGHTQRVQVVSCCFSLRLKVGSHYGKEEEALVILIVPGIPELKASKKQQA
jgi:hypothetical protein